MNPSDPVASGASSSPEYVALIPARGGSKGIYLKNLREVGGVPLLALAVRRARACPLLSRVIVSTDDEDLARCALEEGAEVPGMRPAELAGDETPMAAVVDHCWREHLGGAAGGVRALVLLQPSSPFLRPSTITRAIEQFSRDSISVLKAVRRVREHPSWMLRSDGDALVPFLETPPGRRQDLEDLYIPCGALYIYGADHLENPGAQAPSSHVEIDWPEALDIDETEDLLVAQCLAAFGQVDSLLADDPRTDRQPAPELSV